MGELGGVLGWITGVSFIAALLNYFVKRINKRWITSLPKESSFRSLYQKFMKFVVKNHKLFGIAAGVVVLIHLPVQITGMFASVTGIMAAALLLTAVIMGIVMFYGHKGKLLKVHRLVALSGGVMFLLHLIIKM
jgi:hypothetical protein